MILSSNQELRLQIPSNAVDDVANLQGMLDNSEKDFLKPRLGASLYDRLCKQYASIDPSVFCMLLAMVHTSMTHGTSFCFMHSA